MEKKIMRQLKHNTQYKLNEYKNDKKKLKYTHIPECKLNYN